MDDDTFIFPLNTVLFPGGTLPLKIFEQRYLEMTKVCIRENRPFGVCLIKEGKEVGTPAVPVDVGCLAHITQWDMPQFGMFHLTTKGTQRFRILSSNVQKDGLITAVIETLPEEPHIAPADPLCGHVLKAIIDKLGAEYFPPPHDYDDAAWVGYRLCELLPLDLPIKQEFLQMADPAARLTKLAALFSNQNLRSAP